MKFAYIAGPYRAEHPYQVAANVRRARDVADELALMGYFCIVPHTMTAHMDGIQDDKFWLDGTLWSCCPGRHIARERRKSVTLH